MKLVTATEEIKLKRAEAISLAGKRLYIARLIGWTVFLSLLALILFTAIPYGTVDPWSDAVFECAVFGLTILSIIEIAIEGKLNAKQYTIVLPLLALVAFAFIQTIPLGAGESSLISGGVWNAISADPFETRRWIVKMLALILAGAMLTRYASDERRLRALVWLILAVGLMSALFGIFRQTTQREKGFLFLSRLVQNSGYGQFINRNHFAFLAEMALGLALGFVVGSGVSKERKLIYLAVSLPLWVGLVLSNSRGGLFSMVGQLLFLLLMWTIVDRGRKSSYRPQSLLESLKGSWLLRIPLLCGLLISILIGAVWIGGEQMVSRLETVPSEVSAQGDASHEATSRIEIWRATVRLIKDHPLTGVGFGGYWAAIPQYHQGSGESIPDEAHNDYLELMASGGIVGVLLTFWFLLAFMRRARQVWTSSKGYRKAASLGALTALSGVAIHSLVDFGLHITINALVFTALIVIATINIKSTENAAL